MDQVFFRVAFANAGDRTAIPVPLDASGYVSFTQGYGGDYELDRQTDAQAKAIERKKMNYLFWAMTQALAQYQTVGVPEWITTADNGGSSPFAYAAGVRVRYRNTSSDPWVTYESLADNNTATPGTDDTKWRVVLPTLSLGQAIQPVAPLTGLQASTAYSAGSVTLTVPQITLFGNLGAVGETLTGAAGAPLALPFDLSVVGAGGMASGQPAFSATPGLVGIYAIYNPSTKTLKTYGFNATSADVPEVCPVALPAGYTQSRLLAPMWVTNLGFGAQTVSGRTVRTPPQVLFNEITQYVAYTAFSSAWIAYCAKETYLSLDWIPNVDAKYGECRVASRTDALSELVCAGYRAKANQGNPSAGIVKNVERNTLYKKNTQEAGIGTPTFTALTTGFTF